MHSFDDMHFALSSLVAVVVVLPQQRTPDFHMDEQFLGQQLLWSPIHTGLPVLQYHFCLPALQINQILKVKVCCTMHRVRALC